MDYSPYMRKALELAKRGRFNVYPNPTVGAVLLQGAQVAAEGYHHKFGAPHAEIECLKDAQAKGVDPCGATMVVTLEPCRHHGKTPPCVDAIINAGISRVVYGCKDPNSEASGGALLLAQAGIDVVGPVLEQECKDLIADFITWQTTDMPYVILKMASTLDGRIATRTGHSHWISNEASRNAVHILRDGIGKCGGAVLIGGGTFRTDNPRLSARTNTDSPQPLAAILTSRLPKKDAEYALLKERPQQTIFFASPAAAASTTAEDLRKLGASVIALGPGSDGMPNFKSMFITLRNDFNCPYILCEGGGKLALSLLDAGFVNEFHLFIAPMILGDNNALPLFDGRAPLSLDEAIKMRVCTASSDFGDIFIQLRPS